MFLKMKEEMVKREEVEEKNEELLGIIADLKKKLEDNASVSPQLVQTLMEEKEALEEMNSISNHNLQAEMVRSSSLGQEVMRLRAEVDVLKDQIRDLKKEEEVKIVCSREDMLKADTAEAAVQTEADLRLQKELTGATVIISIQRACLRKKNLRLTSLQDELDGVKHQKKEAAEQEVKELQKEASEKEVQLQSLKHQLTEKTASCEKLTVRVKDKEEAIQVLESEIDQLEKVSAWRKLKKELTPKSWRQYKHRRRG